MAPATAATAAPAAAATGAAAGAAGAAAKTGMAKWAGPLAGIAAGLGLGYLFSKMGAGGFLGVLLLIGLGLAALIWFARSAARKQQPATASGPSSFDAPQSAASAPQPMQYAGTAAGGAAPVMASGLAGGFGIPTDFDKAGFEDNAKKQFMKLQAANDKGDLDGVRDFVTDELYNEIAKDVVGGNNEATQVDDLAAELLGIETERGQYWASVRFSGKMREDGMMMASPFTETWNLVKPVDGSKGWLVAGIQQA
uniref:Putative membrane protein n=1 Tax=uncultured bacterium A1Q1_fos_504 TaxID=1256580 RepID=L7VZZ5_9BACT|nr:putative membrane protein [uncultured bacterium A1Q1_fos_504]